MVNESLVPFVMVPNTVRHNIVPPELALNNPASVIAAELEGVPAGKVATYTTSLLLTVVLVNETRADSDPRTVLPAAAAVEPVPIAM